MTENLRLVGSRTLTSANSDVTSNFTLPASAGGNWPNDEAHVYATGNTSYGNYYSWFTATAGTGLSSMTSGNANSSICPKGWKLPDNTGSKSYYNLIRTKYSLNDSAASSTKIRSAPFDFTYSGIYNAGVWAQGEQGFYWTSTALNNASLAYRLYFRSDSVNPSDKWNEQTTNQYQGLVVRCVSK